MPYLIFLKKRQNWNCRLLQIIGGALRVKHQHKQTHLFKIETKIRNQIIGNLLYEHSGEGQQIRLINYYRTRYNQSDLSLLKNQTETASKANIMVFECHRVLLQRITCHICGHKKTGFGTEISARC